MRTLKQPATTSDDVPDDISRWVFVITALGRETIPAAEMLPTYASLASRLKAIDVNLDVARVALARLPETERVMRDWIAALEREQIEALS
jgi:hypothetical protein